MAKVDPVKIIMLLGFAYRLVLRSVIKSAIDDPNTTWDDAVLAALDKIFDYTEGD